MAETFDCKLVAIAAERPASGAKDYMKGIIKLIPENMLLKLLSSSYMYRFHEKKSERSIKAVAGYDYEKGQRHGKILIVDDSVDTGWTLLRVKNEVAKDFPNAEIKTASYSVIEYSKARISVDFCRNENSVILTATSRQSDEYDVFIAQYTEWVNAVKEQD